MSVNLKIAAARAALEHVEDGMRVGIGTGSTAEEFIRLLARRVAEGFSVVGVATSSRSQSLCEEHGVPMSTLDSQPELDLTIDGADEIDAELSLIKGGGAALLREKIVAAASKRMIVIADASKLVETLGAFALPIEVNRFGFQATKLAIARVARGLGLPEALKARMQGDEMLVTDEGHYLIDASFGRIGDARALSRALLDIPGVVQHGLFIGMADLAIVAEEAGIRELRRSAASGEPT
ncbi:MAG: ribose-5-phosphate isomerase RpiA [Salaquimonas sp.]|nr:ribose-5-phosphate isomerase RpiA [Salaquimonas sp.]